MPDVTISFDDVPSDLAAPERTGPDWQIAGDTLLLHIPGILRALVTGGRTIQVLVEAGRRTEDLAVYLLGTCFAAILQQRGRVVLHASAVSVAGRAMLFCGPSGAGKSTMAAMLSKRGYPLLNDDVCNLSRDDGGNYVVYPDGRMLKLWSASMQHLELSDEGRDRVRHDVDKFYAAPAHVDPEPRPVGGVYVLHASPDGNGPAALNRLSAAESLAELTRNAYRPTLVRAMQMTATYFEASIGMQRKAGVYRLDRVMDFSRVEETFDLLERHWASLKV